MVPVTIPVLIIVMGLLGRYAGLSSWHAPLLWISTVMDYVEAARLRGEGQVMGYFP